MFKAWNNLSISVVKAYTERSGVPLRSEYLPLIATFASAGAPNKSEYLPLVATRAKVGLSVIEVQAIVVGMVGLSLKSL